jgi:hypothetical protein
VCCVLIGVSPYLVPLPPGNDPIAVTVIIIIIIKYPGLQIYESHSYVLPYIQVQVDNVFHTSLVMTAILNQHFLLNKWDHTKLRVKAARSDATKYHTVLKVCLNWSKNYKKLRGLSPQANYTDRATAACQQS